MKIKAVHRGTGKTIIATPKQRKIEIKLKNVPRASSPYTADSGRKRISLRKIFKT